MRTESGNLVFAVPSASHLLLRVGSEETVVDEIASTAAADCAQQVKSATEPLAQSISSLTEATERNTKVLGVPDSAVDGRTVHATLNNYGPKIAATEEKLKDNTDADAAQKTLLNSLQKTVAANKATIATLKADMLDNAVLTKMAARQDASDACNIAGQAYDAKTQKCAAAHWMASAGTGAKCSKSRLGALQMSDGKLSYCNGEKFVIIEEYIPPPKGTSAKDAAVSCTTLKKDHQVGAGKYWVNPDGLKPMEVWCDDGWTLLMLIPGNGFRHVRSNAAYRLPVTPNGGGERRLSSDDITRFNKAPGVQVYRIDPDQGGYLNWFQRASKDTDEWPTNLDCSNRGNLLNGNGNKWRWIVTSYRNADDAKTNRNGDTGSYTGRNHYYPTPYGPQQLFFGIYAGGMRINKVWGSCCSTEGRPGKLWVTDA